MTSIQDIKGLKTRSFLRGLLNRGQGPGEAQATLSKLLDSVTLSDLRQVDSLLRSDSLFRHLEILPENPVASPFQLPRGMSLVPPDPLALQYIGERVNQNSGEVVTAFDLLAALNIAIAARSDEVIATLIGEIVLRPGHSLALARKAAFIIGYSAKETISHRRCVELIDSYGAQEPNFGIMATIDSISSEFNYLDLKYRFRDFVGSTRQDGIAEKVAYLCFAPIALDAAELLPTINAHYEVSVTDAAMAILCHRDLGVGDDLPQLSPQIIAAWERFCATEEHRFDYFGPDEPYGDLQAFRAAPAFLEYRSFREFRAAVQPIYDLPIFRDERSGRGRAFARRFYEGTTKIEDLIPPANPSYEARPERFSSAASGALARSCALVWICDNDPDFSRMTAASMALLMGRTSEVDRLLSTPTLRRGVNTATDPFVKLILQTLLRAHSSATKDSFGFKDQFQRYVRAHHGGDVLAFMETVKELNQDIVQYFALLLDETLLSQMPLLMETSNSVYETRARLLEWHADITGDEVSLEKAKQLRLDRKIAVVRGAINEARINIDAVRFRQWIEQNKLADFSNFIRQDELRLPPITDITDKAKRQKMFLSAHRDPVARALLSITECYAEFCKNADYGIASFLGRRIRHGTLRGTLLNGIPDPAKIDLSPSIAGQYGTWRQEFLASVNNLTSRLHFYDKATQKTGIISAEIDTNDKWQACQICLNAIFEQAQKDHGILSLPERIEQYCWLILELELASIQASIAEARNKFGTLKLRYHPLDSDAIAFEKQVNLTLTDHFNTVISWFKKPPNISPVAELGHVLEVVLTEAHDEYEEFSPKVDFEGDKELTLTGALYYNVYDAMTIAVRNAAKHGAHPGLLAIKAELQSAGNGQVLEIVVGNNVRAGSCPDKALSRMKAAGSGGADGADIVEGLSGIRKLKKMEAERNLLSFAMESIKAPAAGLCVSLRFPYMGIVE